jgi:predicted SAM-dependent methyltransferase
VAAVRLNVGAGDYPLWGWTNIDELSGHGVDVVAHVPPLPYDDESVEELYAGHFLEHLERAEADEFLRECHRVLVPGGRLGLVVPDTAEVMRRYVLGEPAPMEFPAGVHRDLRDLDQLCDAIVFSTAQPSHHQWAYDMLTLRRLGEKFGFVMCGEIDRWHDPRVSTGQWYQCGAEFRKPEVA